MTSGALASRLRRRADGREVNTAPPAILVSASLALASLTGCGITVEPLMPTPVFYTELGIGPLDHIPAEEQWTPRRVYYATTRARGKNEQEITYRNQPSDEVAVGMALIGFGGPDMTWSDLSRASKSSDRDAVVLLSIAGVIEAGRFRPEAAPAESAGPNRAGWILEDIQRRGKDEHHPGPA